MKWFYCFFFFAQKNGIVLMVIFMSKTVLITGGARGLGASISEVFASHGYNIIIDYNKSDNLAESLKKRLETNYNIKVLLVKADISNDKEVKDMFKKIIELYPNIDVLINNAAIAIDNNIKSKDDIEFKRVLDVNLVGTYLVTKYALDLMKNGSIINIASTNGIDTGYIESIDYDASKAGVIALTHDFAKWLSPNIRVNAVAPGWINTDMTSDLNPDFKKGEEEKILLKRFADPEEVANVVYFLASDDARYINDTIIRVDGGRNV